VKDKTTKREREKKRNGFSTRNNDKKKHAVDSDFSSLQISLANRYQVPRNLKGKVEI